MIKKEEVYKIGVINKPHGIKGEVSFTFNDDIFVSANLTFTVVLFFFENFFHFGFERGF